MGQSSSNLGKFFGISQLCMENQTLLHGNVDFEEQHKKQIVLKWSVIPKLGDRAI